MTPNLSSEREQRAQLSHLIYSVTLISVLQMILTFTLENAASFQHHTHTATSHHPQQSISQSSHPL